MAGAVAPLLIRLPPVLAMLLVFGSFNADYVWRTQRLPAPGETRIGSFSAVPGGKGFNQAMAAHRLGAPVLFAAGLGEDGGAAMAHAATAGDALRCHWFATTAPTGTASVVVDAEGRNQIVVAPGANLSVSPHAVTALLEALPDCRMVLCQQENAPATVLALLRAARARGLETIWNPAPAPGPEVDLDALLAAALWLTPNETEFTQLLALRGETLDPETLATLPDAALHAACRRLGATGVVLTLGAAGAFYSFADARGYGRVPSLPVQAIDTTGAGDCFNGALASSCLRWPKHAPDAHLRFACAAAALSTERTGAGLAMPYLAELRARCPDLGA